MLKIKFKMCFKLSGGVSEGLCECIEENEFGRELYVLIQGIKIQIQ